MFNLEEYENAEALSIGMFSFVGFHETQFPTSRGNYFSVMVGDNKPSYFGGNGKEYKIVNMWYENSKHLIDKGKVSFPIKIKLLDNHCAIVVDPRVDPSFITEISYRAPHKFWSLTELVKRQMKIDSGVLKVHDSGNDFIIESKEI